VSVKGYNAVSPLWLSLLMAATNYWLMVNQGGVGLVFLDITVLAMLLWTRMAHGSGGRALWRGGDLQNLPRSTSLPHSLY
jgi:hypothetical protein